MTYVNKQTESIKCSYINCRTGLSGIVVPIASFLPASINGKPIPNYMPRGHAIIGELRLCESCALIADVHQLVNDRRWADICRQIAAAGGSPPDRESLVLMLGSPKNQPLPDSFIRSIQQIRKDT